MAGGNQQQGPIAEGPMDGAVPAIGVTSIIRIPFPGKGHLVLSLHPPAGFKGSTSTVFVMEAGSKYKGLRLDYGFNKATKTVDYHWNIEGKIARSTFPGITNHMPAGTVGKYLFQGAKAFRYVGRTFVVIGAVVDAVSIVEASNPLRRSSQVVSAWAGAWIGAEAGGEAGAFVGGLGGSVIPGVGTAAGGIVVGFIGAVAGGWKGYQLGEKAGGAVYDWAANTNFNPLPKVPVPTEAFLP
jgi:hypothetical protein